MLDLLLLTAVICCLVTPSVSRVELQTTGAATHFETDKAAQEAESGAYHPQTTR